MRVLYCTDTYPPQVNGVSVITSASVEGLSQLGWECGVVTPSYPGATEEPHGLNGADGRGVALLALPSVAMPTYADVRIAAPLYCRVHRMVRTFRPHLIHAETEGVIGRLGQLAARATRTPLVTSYHTDFGKYVTAYGIPWLGGRVSSYIRSFHRRARRTYTPSGPARDDLHRMGVSRVEVWGFGIDTTLFHPLWRTPAMRAALGIPDDAFLFVHVGRLAHEKSVGTLLDAFHHLCNRLPSKRLHLVIAGTGPCEHALRTRASANVQFLGLLDRRTMLPELYASSDAFLFSSLTETLGLVVLEAMASGLPVVAAPVGGVADHLRHEVNGLAYPVGAADVMAHMMACQLERLVRDDVLRARLAVGARATAERLSWAAELDRLDASYREVILEAAQAARCLGVPAALGRSDQLAPEAPFASTV